MTKEKKDELDGLCLQFRKELIQVLHSIQTGHPGGSLSVCEILTDLYFNDADVTVENFGKREQDKVVLCKGHAAPMLYECLAHKGFFPAKELWTLRHIDSRLQGHPCSKETPGVEVSTGPLGLGYPIALGMALSDMQDGLDNYTYAILGDGEIQEGVIWETAQNAAKFKADRLISILDWNGVQLDGPNDVVMPLQDVVGKFKAFGYNTIVIDGHDVEAIESAIGCAKSVKGKPTIILAKTIKGKGISFMEGQSKWHGAPISDDNYGQAMKELEGEH
jgi:transketolase